MNITFRRLIDIARAMGLQDRDNDWEFRIEHVASTILLLKRSICFPGEIYTWCKLQRNIHNGLFTSRLSNDEGYDFSSYVSDTTEPRLIMTLQGFLENYVKMIKETVVTTIRNRQEPRIISYPYPEISPVIQTTPFEVVQDQSGTIHIVDPITQPEVSELRLATPPSDGIRYTSS